MYPQSPAFVLSTQKKVSPFPGTVPFPFLVLLEMRSWVAGCEDLTAMAQEEEPTLAPYPGHLPNLLMLLLGQMLSIYYLSWALKSIEDISSISGGVRAVFQVQRNKSIKSSGLPRKKE